MPYDIFKYPITSYFGEVGKSHPTPHTGIDIATPLGTKAQALFTGRITDVVLDDPILGKAVYLTNSSGEELVYGHLNNVMVYKGQQVLQGHIVGFTGNTGRSTGEHLHLALFDKGGTPLNINNWIERLGDRITGGFIEALSDGGLFLFDCFKTVIIAYMIWSCYCIMMHRRRIGLPPFSDATPIDSLGINAMFFSIVSIIQGILR